MRADEIQRRTREIFRQEAADLLVELEAALLELEARPTDGALIDRVFRAMHTLKGSGSTSGFVELSAFVHRVEDVFNAAREHRITVTPELINRALRVGDTVNRYLAADPADAAAVLAGASGLLDDFRAFLPETPPPPAGATPAGDGAPRQWQITFAPHPEFFLRGNDPAMFLDELRRGGDARVTAVTDRLPPLTELNPEHCYLRWQIALGTALDETAIRDVFQFVDDVCDLRIAAASAATAAEWELEFQVSAASAATPGLVAALWRDLETLGSVSVLTKPDGDRLTVPGTWRLRLRTAANADEIASVFIFALDANLQLSPTPSRTPPPSTAAAAPTTATPPTAGAAATDPTGGRNDLLRVPAEKLDRLVNLVGELVILRSQVTAACGQLAAVPPELRGAAEGLDRLSAELRDLALNVRMMPVRETFTKFRRLVRDLSRDLGKEVDLVVHGEDTEMDKSMLDQLNDPLLHLVRNSLDHGLEPPDARERAGKPRRGQVRLTAEQRGDRVWITVADDGRGLSAEAIRAKAVAKGLIAAEARLGDAELYQLVFLPGFSTAAAVSQTSGRGVGMDVVKKRVELLRGTVVLHSAPGRGAEIRLSLPLTLAIIEGLMVEVDGERYVVPLTLVREIIERPRLRPAEPGALPLVELRGQPVPYLRARELFGFPARAASRERIVIVELEDVTVGLAVDEVLGSHQTVLKSLGWGARHVKVFSGATIAGDGRVALIIDVPALLAHAAARAQAPTPLPPPTSL